MSVVVVPGSWSAPTPSSTVRLKEKVARLYGLNGDSKAESEALDFLDETVMELNTRLFEFMLIRETGITLTADTQEYTLTSNFFKEKSAFLVKSDGVQQRPLTYLDWATYRRLYGEQLTNSNTPDVYSAFNTHTNGQVSLAPAPSAGDASDYTLSVEYYRRIPLPSEVSELDIPQEVENAILYGAYKKMAIHIQGAYHPDVATFEALFDKAIDNLQAQDRRHPDEKTRFRLVDRRGGGRIGRGTIYIKID